MKIVEPSDEAIREAAQHLLAGRLVGMPTETVYGVAANAMDSDAVRATFAAKGRPAENPLIVHLSSLDRLNSVVSETPPVALDLAHRFWPGPLTLVLPKHPGLPSVVTAGLDTVAVRVPAHPVALRLLETVGVPLTAPSANPFMGLSPTTASSIESSVSRHLAMVLEGGPCEVGIESTVLDLTGEPRVLRPGGLSVAELEAAIGQPVVLGASTEERRSPGQYSRHYAPRTPVVLVDRLADDQPGLALRTAAAGQINMPDDPREYAQRLYAALRALDDVGHETIFVEKPPDDAAWLAVWDRLRRAAG